MRYLGIDHGTSYIGLALGDDESYLALPFDTIAEKDEDQQLKQVEAIVLEEGIDVVVIGLPLTMSGGSSEQTGRTISFITELSGKLSIPVKQEDERLTSKMGTALKNEFPGGKYDDHALAATAILQTFLQKKQNDV
jgi:putative Holliday junction resolvase